MTASGSESGGIAREPEGARRSAVVTGSKTAADRKRASHAPPLTRETDVARWPTRKAAYSPTADGAGRVGKRSALTLTIRKTGYARPARNEWIANLENCDLLDRDMPWLKPCPFVHSRSCH